MESNYLLPILVGLILIGAVVVPVHADDVQEYVNVDTFARDASMNFLGIQIFDSKPEYQMTAEDYISRGKYYHDGCQRLSTQYNVRIKTWATNQAQKFRLLGNEPPDIRSGFQQRLDFLKSFENPSQKQRLWLLSEDTFLSENPDAFSLHNKMVMWCNAARDNYNMAASKTAKTDYKKQAEIYDGAAGVYDTMGNKTAAEDARDEAAFARGRQRLASGSDCLIVTATFGSPMAGEVQLVRDFRDGTVQQNYLGSRYVTALNAGYYSFSPAVARSIDENPSVKPAMRIVLAPLLGIVLLSQGMYLLLSFSPEVATVAFIIVGGALVGLVYILPVMLSAFWVAGKRGWHVPWPGSLKPLAFVWAGLLALLVISAVLEIDLLAVLSSGLLFACTVVFSASAVALYLAGYVRPRPARDE